MDAARRGAYVLVVVVVLVVEPIAGRFTPWGLGAQYSGGNGANVVQSGRS